MNENGLCDVLYEGTIESLNYPGDYEDDEWCEWTIKPLTIPYRYVS